MTLVAIILAIPLGLYAFTDIPTRWGWRAPSDHTNRGADDPSVPSAHAHADDQHADDQHAGHAHAGHDDENSVELTPQARSNMRLETAPLTVGVYTKYVEVPGVVANWPGRTHIAVTSPLTGVLNAIYVSRGELIASNKPLFSLRLTHQDLVNTQETFLTKLGELDVELEEIERLTAVAGTGAIAAKSLLERRYERDKLLAGVRAARQALMLHGLSEEQIETIELSRKLIREVVVYSPTLHADQSLHQGTIRELNHHAAARGDERLASNAQPPTSLVHPHHIAASFLVTELEVRRGQGVNAGQELLQISDYSQILIEGQAFQQDGQALRMAADTSVGVQAVIKSGGSKAEMIDGLKVVYIGTEVGRQSRVLPFYVALENKIERTDERGEQRYISWAYKPGQRLTIRLPESQIQNAIVVPKEAIAEEGPERYVFVENGDHFDRIPVHVLAKDSINVAIANDGQVWPGQSIAVSGAHQLQMVVKNKSGGAIDPHAGHTH
ncbi:efflux RND transporter periplasmic adaptor subunit [bacterium]|nr:efflux RND transporter periplasmic adaptor subunit [bacterium]